MANEEVPESRQSSGEVRLEGVEDTNQTICARIAYAPISEKRKDRPSAAGYGSQKNAVISAIALDND